MVQSGVFELIVLGVGQDAGNPQAGCIKPCCRDPRRRCLPAAMAILDRAENRFWLLDATPRLPEQLRRMQDITGNRGQSPVLAGILLTHAHIGHYTGLMYCGREAMNTKSLPVYVMPRMRAFLQDNGPWSQLIQLGNIKLFDLDDYAALQLAPDLSVRSLRVPHRGEYSETVAFVVSGPRRSALYLPDIDAWDEISPPLAALLGDVDAAWLDATFYDDAELPAGRLGSVPHPPVVETLKMLAPLDDAVRARVRLLHFNHTNPLLDPDSHAAETVRAAGLHLAREGERFEL